MNAHRTRTHGRWLELALAGLVAACSAEPTPSNGSGTGCEPLARVACACPDGSSSGQQTCNAEGSAYSECLGCGMSIELGAGMTAGVGTGGLSGTTGFGPAGEGQGGVMGYAGAMTTGGFPGTGGTAEGGTPSTGGAATGGTAGGMATGGTAGSAGSAGGSAGASGSASSGSDDVPDTPECAAAADWPAEWVAWEEQVLALVNQERAEGNTCGGAYYGPAAALVMNPILRCSARLHSLDMLQRDFFSHTNPDGVGSCERMADLGYRWSAIAENISTYSTPESAVSTWMQSTGHCQNIMSPDLEETGVGYAGDAQEDYWTQTFGTPGGGTTQNCY
jgi:uncharacterized protein YkwD